MEKDGAEILWVGVGLTIYDGEEEFGVVELYVIDRE